MLKRQAFASFVRQAQATFTNQFTWSMCSGDCKSSRAVTLQPGFLQQSWCRGGCNLGYKSKPWTSDLYDDIGELLREFDPDTESIRSLKVSINNLAKQADDLDHILIDILINYCNKLPLCTRIDEEIGEAELQGTYIDPLLYPLFHNPQKNKYYRWLNKQVSGTDVRRPDGNLYRMNQRKIDSSIGYVETKRDRSESTKRHEDMIRLVAFCQKTLNSTKLNAMTAIQAVGYYISFYHFIKVGSVDLMIELYSFEVPRYIGQLLQTFSSFNHLNQVMVCSEKYCVNDDSTNPQTRKRENNDRNLDQTTLPARYNNIFAKTLLDNVI
ncbi:hypothetical protein BDC45DRAFT_607048 [Circinella umbellata]|nr:hypothetical protein BDC45DRAFT_607048 [Circinella umbellata]